jgi:hypothetical protein
MNLSLIIILGVVSFNGEGAFVLVLVITTLITCPFLINSFCVIGVNLIFKNLNFSTIQHPVSQHLKQLVKKSF